MRLAEVIGRVTLSRCHPSLKGATWRLVVPLTWEGLVDRTRGRGEAFVAYDEQRSGIGDLIAVSEGGEAAAPFEPDVKPIDAYNAAILDQLDVDLVIKS
jgi:ethanolamine utilization protein EutN